MTTRERGKEAFMSVVGSLTLLTNEQQRRFREVAAYFDQEEPEHPDAKMQDEVEEQLARIYDAAGISHLVTCDGEGNWGIATNNGCGSYTEVEAPKYDRIELLAHLREMVKPPPTIDDAGAAMKKIINLVCISEGVNQLKPSPINDPINDAINVVIAALEARRAKDRAVE